MHRPVRALFLAILLLLGAAGAYTAFAENAAGGKPPVSASAAPIDIVYPEPTPVTEIYRAVGKAFGIQVLFDTKLRDVKVPVELESVTADQALRIITRTVGHFAAVLDERTVLIAEDTPQNRRIHDTQVMRTFHLENMELKDAMTMVRSLLGMKNVTATQGLNGLTMRDTAAKIQIAERLLATVDKPRGEVALGVEVLYFQGAAPFRGAEGHRISSGELERLRRTARRLTSQELAVLDNDHASWALQDTLIFGRGGESSSGNVGFELEVRPQLHAASDEVTLDLRLALSDLTEAAELEAEDVAAAISTHKVESGVRLRNGETFLLTGLAVGPFAEKETSWLASRFDLPAGPGEVVLALTPRIVRGAGFAESDLAAICVGTEVTPELCDHETELRTAENR